MPSVPSLGELFGSLFRRLPDDPETRAELRALATALLELASSEPSAEPRPGPPAVSSEPSALPPSLSDEEFRDVTRDLVRSLSQPPAAPPPATLRPRSDPSDPTLPPRIENRCRLKAEGARWAAERQRRLARQADFHTEILPRDRDLIARARALPDCYLWMCTPQAPSPSDLSLFEDLAGCFDCLADATALLRVALDEEDRTPEHVETAIDLAAEAQSSLLAALQAIDGPNDPDQLAAFTWIREIAASRHFFIRNHMRRDDMADPRHHPELAQRLEQARSRVEEQQGRKRRVHQLLNKLRYISGKIAEGRDDQWEGLVATTRELVTLGLAPSHPEIRDALLPVVDDLPPHDDQDYPDEFRLVLGQIDRFLALHATAPAEEPADRTPSPSVAEVRKLLAGKVLLLIGGERRPQHQELLRRSFGLAEVIWPDAAHHMSVETFGPAVARPEVALVLLAIRWSSHAFGDVKHMCDAHGKPLVRLPGGYNVNQVASQILEQCGDRLRSQLPG
jgi:hypothetical protein